MAVPDEQDREAVDRAFAELVAGYHLTAERPEAPTQAPEPPAPAPPPEHPTESGLTWADDHPLFRFEPEPEPAPAPEPEERFEPPESEPLPKPAWPVLLAWVGMGYAMLTMLAVVVGIQLPGWAGWLAILGFVGGFGVLVARLPRHRPPDSGDGAVL